MNAPTSPAARLILRTLAAAPTWDAGQKYAFVHRADMSNGHVAACVPHSVATEFEQVCSRPALLVKVALALPALWLAGPRDNDNFVSVTGPALLDLLGYERYRRAHRGQAQRVALAAARVVLSLEIVRIDGDNESLRRVSGRAFDAHVTDRAQRGGLWVPATLRYRPGAWLTLEDRAHGYGQVAHLPHGLMGLANDIPDDMATRLGAALVPFSRLRRGPIHLRARTLLADAGISPTPDSHHRRERREFEKAMNRLVDAGVLVGWAWESAPPERGGDWRNHVLIATWAHPKKTHDCPAALGNLPRSTRQNAPQHSSIRRWENATDNIDNIDVRRSVADADAPPPRASKKRGRTPRFPKNGGRP